MFDINHISYSQRTGQYTCSCQCNSLQKAEELCCRYIDLSRMVPSGRMFTRGSAAFIEAYSFNDVYQIANIINTNYFLEPLDVYVFYGNQKGLDSRWCIGFDFPNAFHIIEALNKQGPLIQVDGHPENWCDSNGTSYSIVMLTGITNQQLTNETAERLNQMVTLYRAAIRNTTFREINPVIVQ